jgi:hypothetical protein
MPRASKLQRTVFATLTLLAASATSAAAQLPPDPVAPYTPEAAARAVDRFVAAFNDRDQASLEVAFAATATAFTFDKDNQFRAIAWLPSPWSYHQLQANQLRMDQGSWRLAENGRARLSVLERLVSASLVVQRERIRFQDFSGQQATLDWMVHYQVRNGRILNLWVFPPEELDAPVVSNPRYGPGEGPVVWFDVGHGNLDTPEGSYFRFVELLRRDGYTVETWEGPFTPSRLDTIELLVIVNAMPTAATDSAPPPRSPSAFTRAEEQALESWVRSGGALLLVADHEPMAGAAASLASRFGAEFRDGRARDTTRVEGNGDLFHRSDGSLRPHAITNQAPLQPRIDSVATYLGQAFPPNRELEPLLVLPGGWVLDEPTTAEGPSRTEADGWLQGGVRDFGQGRVALFGEAWMFRFFGRGQNADFVLNLVNWLAPER